jgi:CrcB protein
MPMSLITQIQFVCLVFVGGGIGAVARYGTTLASVALFGPHFPWGTLTVNVVGSAVMGAFAGLLMTRAPGTGSDAFRLFFMTGILGGFTTFSAFSLDALVLWQRGATATAIGYVLASIGLSVLALAVALFAVRNAVAS